MDSALDSKFPPRISIRDGKFSRVMDGIQESMEDESSINLVVINAADIARTFYSGAYDPDNPSAPTCWSLDTQLPSLDVPEGQAQAKRCMDCQHNIKGSGGNGGRACRYSQRLAVALEGQMDTIYHLNLPATSIFGNIKDGHMGLQAYAKFLSTRRTNSISVITQVYFDEKSYVPKLYFKALRPLTIEEVQYALELKSSDAASKAALQKVTVSNDAVTKTSPFTEVDGFIYK